MNRHSVKVYFDYLEKGLVPEDEKAARKLAAERTTSSVWADLKRSVPRHQDKSFRGMVTLSLYMDSCDWEFQKMGWLTRAVNLKTVYCYYVYRIVILHATYKS